jgi:hypothetical protein
VNAEVCVPPVNLLEVDAAHALRVSRWLEHCGGVSLWGTLDLSDPSRQWFTPAQLTDGTPAGPPHWSAPREPERVITDPAQVEVVERNEVQRLRVSVRRSPYGLRRSLTDRSSSRLRKAVADAGEGATYAFEGDVAVVFAVSRRLPLRAWLQEQGHAETS